MRTNAGDTTKSGRTRDGWDESPGIVGNADMATATILWAGATAAFVRASHGASLLVTFVPGICASQALVIWLWRTKRPLPAGRDLWPWYLLALAVQFVHFAEENATGFAAKFPELYGGTPYSQATFTSFNMASYAVFTIASIALWRRRSMVLLLPLLFFCIYGALGNAIAHTVWTITTGNYFPGWITSLAFWPIGVLILHRLLGESRQRTKGIIVLVAAVLIPLIVAFVE